MLSQTKWLFPICISVKFDNQLKWSMLCCLNDFFLQHALLNATLHIRVKFFCSRKEDCERVKFTCLNMK